MSDSKAEVIPMSAMDDKVPDNKTWVFEECVQPCVAELLATALFVFVGCASVIANPAAAGVVQPAVAHGLALAVLIVVFAQISGGHLNPAVSLSVYLCGGMQLLLLPTYVIAQLIGGMIGAALAKAVFPPDVFDAALGASLHPGSTDLGRATLTETVLTLILTTVVCMTAVNKQTRSSWAPFCIGLSVSANILAGGTLSGACMNPARALGPAVAANQWEHHWIYWVGPTCGALLTALLVRLMFGDKKTRLCLK